MWNKSHLIPILYLCKLWLIRLTLSILSSLDKEVLEVAKRWPNKNWAELMAIYKYVHTHETYSSKVHIAECDAEFRKWKNTRICLEQSLAHKDKLWKELLHTIKICPLYLWWNFVFLLLDSVYILNSMLFKRTGLAFLSSKLNSY